jgi:hypothetical protein
VKRIKRITTLFLLTLLCVNTATPAFAEDSAPAAYTVQFSQVEQTVLNSNLQVDSNELTIGSMDNKNELKAKYKKISDTIDQASANLTAIIGNSQTSADLKAVAQSTNVALSSLSAMLNAQEEISDDDYKLTELQGKLSDYQLVKSAQSMFLVYYQLKYNLEQLSSTRVLLNDTLKTAQAQSDLGLGTSAAVADAKAALDALDNSITDLQDQSKSIGYQMNQLLGHPYNDQITFGPLPDPDSGYAAKISLSSDVAVAQEASYKVQIYKKQRSILNDDTAANREKRQIMSNNAEMERQSVGASLEKQYAAIKKQQAIIATEQQKLANAKLRLDQAQKQFNAGVLSAMKLNKAKNDYFTEQAALKTASATWFWNIESYKWIVKGLPAA